MNLLSKYREQLNLDFSGTDFYQSHLKANGTLLEMASNDETLFEILAKNIGSKKFLSSLRINPVIALPMIEESNYTLVANCWIPRPDGNIELSHQSIHHHGNLLLSSVGAFGSGYESMLFEKIKASDNPDVKIKLSKIYSNPRGHIEFVDAYTPHIVFYPEKLSITFALWSRAYPLVTNRISKFKYFSKIKGPLRKTMQFFKLGELLHLNQDFNLDYAVQNGKIVQLKKRALYSPGTNQSFLLALRYIARNVGFNRLPEMELLDKMILDKTTNIQFDNAHLYLPGANIEKKEILACL